jgi:glycerol dehydrogenase-like iron-containing ADH family enzyme
MKYLNTLKQSLKELKFSDDFSNNLIEILKQKNFEEFEVLLDKKIKELFQQVDAESLEDFNEFFELIKEDVLEKKEKVKKLAKERDEFEK